MALLDVVSRDLQAAMKSGDRLKTETLRMIRAALLEKQVEKRPSGGMTQDDEIAVLISASKKRKESIEIFRKNGRNDLADQETLELEIVHSYLPKQLGEKEIEEVVIGIISVLGEVERSQFPKVMPLVMKELKGRADGRLVQEIVHRLIGG